MTRAQYAAVAGRAELLVSGAAMACVLDRLAVEIAAALGDDDPLVLCVMTGGIVATGLLLPRLKFPLGLDYVHVTRYRGATRGGAIKWLHPPSAAVGGRQVLVVDDILDEGLTLEAIVRACRNKGAAGVRVAVLVEKLRQRTCECRADFVGVQLPNRYLYGYGLDYRGYFRNADGIYAVADQDG